MTTVTNISIHERKNQMVKKRISIVGIFVSMVLLSTLGIVNAQELIDVTVVTVDQYDDPVDGKVAVEVGDDAMIGGNSPFTYEQSDGDQAHFAGGWGALNLDWIPGRYSWMTISKDMTYTIFASTKEVIPASSPGINRIKIVFESIPVTVATVDQDGNPLDGGAWVQKNSGMGAFGRLGGPLPFCYEQANGGAVEFNTGWGALDSGLIPSDYSLMRIYKDTTYKINALTQEVEIISTPGVSKVNFVFEPILVTLATLDQDGNPLDGDVWVQKNSGIGAFGRLVGVSPYTYEQANGGKVQFYGFWGDSTSGWIPGDYSLMSIFKDTIYSISALNKEVESEDMPNVNQVNIIFIKTIPATVNINPDVLNLKSKGKWITCYIELDEGYDVTEIDIDTILLNSIVPAESKPTMIKDFDGDGKSDLMIKFDRSTVEGILGPGEEIQITVKGEVTRIPFIIPFEGSDMIRVID